MSETNNKKGCTLTAILVVLAILLVLAIPIAIFGLYVTKSRTVWREARMQEEHTFRTLSPGHASTSDNRDNHLVTFTEKSLERLSNAEVGDELTREQFTARMADSNATSLSRQFFIRKANGRTIRWLVRTCEVHSAENSGSLHASFDLPYNIEVAPSSWSGSSIQISAEFPASELERLAKIRRNDWVTIEGRLEISENNTTILHEAKILGDSH